ncbi:MAG: response regulator transcription factor [Acidimicrobiales bacterium]
MKVLVVDDSRAMRMIVARELRRSVDVDEIVEADSAAAAVELLQQQSVDLVLSDWNMPGMSGLEFLQGMRAQGWKGLFGFVTSESAPSTRQRALEAGATFLVTKPFRGDVLANQITIALGGPAAHLEESTSKARDQADEVADVLEGLLHKKVNVAAADGPARRELARVAARYVDAAGRDAAMCVVEVPLAAAVGAALSMMPAASAEEWGRSGVLPEVVAQNFYEVANVLAKVIASTDGRCVLAELTVHADFERLPHDGEIESSPRQVHVDVDVDGYGSGRLTLATLAT